jgi:uncharacterized membrane protein YuzA (DUF378 family)
MKAIAAMNLKHITLIIAASIATYGLVPALLGVVTMFVKEIAYLIRGIPM